MPSIEEHGPFYYHWAQLTKPGWGLNRETVRQYEWPYKKSRGWVIKLRRKGLLVGIWRKNRDLYKLEEEELLVQAIQATAEGYFKEQQIGRVGNVEWVPIESVRGKDRNW